MMNCKTLDQKESCLLMNKIILLLHKKDDKIQTLKSYLNQIELWLDLVGENWQNVDFW